MSHMKKAWFFLHYVTGGEFEKKLSKKTKKAKVEETIELVPWQLLSCPVDMPRAKKAWVVIRAKQGIRPDWIKPAVWAWHILNPNGIRRKK